MAGAAQTVAFNQVLAANDVIQVNAANVVGATTFTVTITIT